MRYLGLIIFLLSWNLFADIIYLKDGNVIEGKIINQTRTNIQIQLEDQKIITLNKERIERIFFGPTQNEIEEQKRQEELKRKQQEEQKRLEQQKREEEIKRKQEEIKQQQEALRKKLQEPTVQYNHFFDISLLVGPNIQKPIIGRYLRSLLATGSKVSFFDNKPNETSIHVAKDKLKDSYTLNTRLSYTNPYLNLGIDFFFYRYNLLFF
jgi:multidrug efflux pump subunit AcrA (membrane-fusion protein)